MTNNIKTTILAKDLITGYRVNGKFKPVPSFNINFDAKEGELIALIGSNGSGKTTLLRTIAGLHPSKSGDISICGLSPLKANRLEFAKSLSIATTELLKIAYTSVNDFVMLGRFPYSHFFGKLTTKDLQIVDMAIEETGIASKRDEQMNCLSDGERQRAIIARTLAQDTPVILLDEPTAYLDIKNKIEILNLLKSLTSKYRKTIIFSTHDLATALHLADKIWLITSDKMISKIPEQIIFDDDLAKEFNSDFMQIDKNTGNFNFIDKYNISVGLIGDYGLYGMTLNALKRIGFNVISNKSDDLNVIIEENEKLKIWKLINANEELVFNQLEDLILHLKMLKQK